VGEKGVMLFQRDRLHYALLQIVMHLGENTLFGERDAKKKQRGDSKRTRGASILSSIIPGENLWSSAEDERK